MRVILLPGLDGTGLLFNPLLEVLPRKNIRDSRKNIGSRCLIFEHNVMVTSNIKDFKRGVLKSHPFKAITPGDFYRLWRCEHE